MRDARKAFNTYDIRSNDVELLSSRKQWLIFILTCVILACINVGIEYRNFLKLPRENPASIYAQVIAQYTKRSEKTSKPYEVLKLKTGSGETLYITSKENIKDLTYAYVRIFGKVNDCTFLQYLRSCFFLNYSLDVLHKRDVRNYFRNFINIQHKAPDNTKVSFILDRDITYTTPLLIEPPKVAKVGKTTSKAVQSSKKIESKKSKSADSKNVTYNKNTKSDTKSKTKNIKVKQTNKSQGTKKTSSKKSTQKTSNKKISSAKSTESTLKSSYSPQSLKTSTTTTKSITQAGESTLLPDQILAKETFDTTEESAQEPLDFARFYRTLYIADFLPKNFRDTSNALMIAHLIAISGFHLGVLNIMIGLLAACVYSLLHRYYTYRNKFFDIGIFSLALLFLYLVVLDFSPSFLRAWVMAFVSFVMLASGVKILNFKFLFIIVLFCIALFPRILFSIGFFLSVSGVFFIYLFLRYFKLKSRNILCNYLVLPLFFNASIFLQMLILVNYFFPYFSKYSILSIPLSVVFVVFFPLSMILHAITLGDLFDPLLTKLFSLQIYTIELYSPNWLFWSYMGLSLYAIKSKGAYALTYIFSLGFLGVLYAKLYGFVS